MAGLPSVAGHMFGQSGEHRALSCRIGGSGNVRLIIELSVFALAVPAASGYNHRQGGDPKDDPCHKPTPTPSCTLDASEPATAAPTGKERTGSSYASVSSLSAASAGGVRVAVDLACGS